MGIEIETKIRLKNKDELVAHLTATLGNPHKDRTLCDIYFDDAKDPNRHRASDCSIRVRFDPQAKYSHRPAPNGVVTWKGPKHSSKIKRREEIEFTIQDEDVDTVVQFFEKLGLKEQLRYSKRRRSWYVGNCVVEVDEVPELGDFVEIEGPSEGDIAIVQESLGIQGKHVSKGYFYMLMEQKKHDACTHQA